MPTVPGVSSLFSSSSPCQGPLWGCHRVSGKPRAHGHSSCHVWWNQSEKAPPLPVPLKTAAQGGTWSLGPLPHITSGGLWVPCSHPHTLRLLLGIQLQAQVWWAFSESPVPRPVLCLWKACLPPRTVTRLAWAEGMAGGWARQLHKPTLSSCFTPGAVGKVAGPQERPLRGERPSRQWALAAWSLRSGVEKQGTTLTVT